MTRKDYLIELLNRNAEDLKELREKTFKVIDKLNVEIIEKLIAVGEKFESRKKRIEAGDEKAVSGEIKNQQAIAKKKESKKFLNQLHQVEMKSRKKELEEAENLLKEFDI